MNIQIFNILEYLSDTIKKQNPEQKWIIDNLILLTPTGSQIYGTSTENSDIDIKGICVAPLNYWVGATTFQHYLHKNEELKLDIEIIDVRKFCHFTSRVSPNIIELLFIPDEMLVKSSYCWTWLKGRAKELLNQSAYDAYHGYGMSQIKKLMIKQSNKTGRQYITEEFGFDTKFLMHAFRLVRQGTELLKTGNISFPRPDKDDLLDIRLGRKYKSSDRDKTVEDWESQLPNAKAVGLGE